MSAFKSAEFFATDIVNLNPVAQDVYSHFSVKGYDVNTTEIAGGFLISLSKGGIFKAVLGMKTALNITINRTLGGVSAQAAVGIFGQQLIPSVITMFIAWPVLISQITGMIQQSKLDDEALRVVGQSIRRHENAQAARQTQTGGFFCVACGAHLGANSAFCNICGAKQE